MKVFFLNVFSLDQHIYTLPLKKSAEQQQIRMKKKIMKKYAPPNLWRMKFEHNLLILAEDTKKKKNSKTESKPFRHAFLRWNKKKQDARILNLNCEQQSNQ